MIMNSLSKEKGNEQLPETKEWYGKRICILAKRFTNFRQESFTYYLGIIPGKWIIQIGFNRVYFGFVLYSCLSYFNSFQVLLVTIVMSISSWIQLDRVSWVRVRTGLSCSGIMAGLFGFGQNRAALFGYQVGYDSGSSGRVSFLRSTAMYNFEIYSQNVNECPISEYNKCHILGLYVWDCGEREREKKKKLFLFLQDLLPFYPKRSKHTQLKKKKL